MARIINVEKSQYLTQNIENYTQNKVGQYSKYLDKNPIFVTWLSISKVHSRYDVGTGGVESDVGPKSPIRWIRVNGLPTYNIPELKPEIEFDENGYDLDMNISDAVLLPGTITPQAGDYLIISLPNSYEVAFRINEFGYNTIQSNDFYLYSADIKYVGKNLIDRFKGQIIDEFETIFDNIGTEDKCFIRSVDVDKIKNIGLLINELKDLYRKNYFDKTTGCFVSKNNDEDEEQCEAWLYDRHVEKFIMDSEIYYSQLNDPDSIVLVPADIDENIDQVYSLTLFDAVKRKDTLYLKRFPYYYQHVIHKPLSTFKIHDINVKSVTYHLTDYPLLDFHSDGLESKYLMELFPHALIHKILDDDEFEENDEIVHKYDPHYCNRYDDIDECETDEDPTILPEDEQDDYPNTEEEDVPTADPENPDDEIDDSPFPCDNINDESNTSEEEENPSENEESETPENSEDCDECHRKSKCPYKKIGIKENPALYHPCKDDEYEFTYLDTIIYNYLMNKNIDYDRRNIVKFALQLNNYVYRMMPMIIYIMTQYYESYFKKEGTEEL